MYVHVTWSRSNLSSATFQSVNIQYLLWLRMSGSYKHECKRNGMCRVQRTACLNMLICFFALQVQDNKPVRPKSAMLPEKDYSLSELLSQVDSGISRSFDRVKEDSCHMKENTCKRLSGISSADSAFSSQDSITLSFEKESTYGTSLLKTYNLNCEHQITI